MSRHKLSFSCQCSQVKGEIVIETSFPGNHIQCYCVDCQNFQKLLNNSFNQVDPNGGTEIYQTYPALYEVQAGFEFLKCFRFNEKGIYRWYTSCCHSHMANTLPNSKIAFIGMPVSILKLPSKELESSLGPITLKAFGKYAKPQKPHDAIDTLPIAYTFKILPFMFRGIFKKLAAPHPFFHDDGNPIADPQDTIDIQRLAN